MLYTSTKQDLALCNFPTSNGKCSKPTHMIWITKGKEDDTYGYCKEHDYMLAKDFRMLGPSLNLDAKWLRVDFEEALF